MKRLFLFLFVLIIAVWFGLHIEKDPGYVLLNYHHWVVEMPMWVAVIIFSILFIILYGILRSLAYFRLLGSRYYDWHYHRQHRRSQLKTTQGLIALAEGHWPLAEKTLLKAGENSEQPLINYLAAAKAAQEQRAFQRRDHYLRAAQKAAPNAKIAVVLTQAQLQMNCGQLEQALASLKRLQTLSLQHPYVLKLLTNVYQQLGDWESLLDLLPQLRKQSILPEHELSYLEQKAYRSVLENMAKKQDLNRLQILWMNYPKYIRRIPEMIHCYIQQLIVLKGYDVAEKIIQKSLKKSWDDELVKLYRFVESDDPQKQFNFAESWLTLQATNPELLLTLGCLAKRNELWGKARHYLENTIQIKPSLEAYKELSDLLDKLDEKQEAMKICREALEWQVADDVKASI